MSFFELMGIFATIALLLPVTLILAYRLTFYRIFPALLGYLILLLVCNFLLLNYIPLGSSTDIIQLTLQNVLVAPLIILFLTYFSRTSILRRRMLWTLYAVLAYEVVVLIMFGASKKSAGILPAPGLSVAIGFSLVFFVHQVKLTITYQKALGKALMVSALLFASIGFSYVYGVRCFTLTGYQHDADLIQFFIIIITSITLGAGIFFEQKRVKQLEELRITREELKELYGVDDEKAADPFEPAAINLNSDSWN